MIRAFRDGERTVLRQALLDAEARTREARATFPRVQPPGLPEGFLRDQRSQLDRIEGEQRRLGELLRSAKTTSAEVAQILELALKLAQLWLDQEGFNADDVDKLAEACAGTLLDLKQGRDIAILAVRP